MNWFFSVIKVCLLTFPVPSTSSLVTDESQLAGACCHILSAPVGVVDPTSPTEVSIGQSLFLLLWIVFDPRSLALFQRKSMMSGVQWRYMSQPAVVAAVPVLIRVWNVTDLSNFRKILRNWKNNGKGVTSSNSTYIYTLSFMTHFSFPSIISYVQQVEVGQCKSASAMLVQVRPSEPNCFPAPQ